MHIVVVGGGRMGLPLACCLAEHGATATVSDVNQQLVDAINAGRCPYEEPGLEAYLGRNVKEGRLKAATDTTDAVARADAVIVIVPALLTDEKDIDYSILKAASTDIGRGMRPGTLVCYETTVAVGGTRAQLIPALEKASGMRAGPDFQVAFSPERVKANQVFTKLQETPKVVGGLDPQSLERAVHLYGDYLGVSVINVGTLEAAELTKLAGMLYRDVNIALANELAALSEVVGVDFGAVREAANTNGEAYLLLPGIGVGGHCTPVYPHFVIEEAERLGVPQRLAKVAREINNRQPSRHLARLAKEWQPLKDKRVHIMGLGFRPDVKVDPFSPAYDIRDALLGHHAIVSIEDPLYTDDELRAKGFTPARIGQEPLDAVVLNTSHSAFATPDFAQWRASGVEAVVDGRAFWDAQAVQAAGLLYLGVGRGGSAS